MTGLLALVLFCWAAPVAEIIHVVDGDTVDLRLAVWAGSLREYPLSIVERVRLIGVDTPERHGATRDAGNAARAFTAAWLSQHRASLTVWTCRRDSFGRLLGGIAADGQTLASALLLSGHAVIYERGQLIPDVER